MCHVAQGFSPSGSQVLSCHPHLGTVDSCLAPGSHTTVRRDRFSSCRLSFGNSSILYLLVLNVGNFREWSISSLVIIIPFPHSHPFPAKLSTSKFRGWQSIYRFLSLAMDNSWMLFPIERTRKTRLFPSHVSLPKGRRVRGILAHPKCSKKRSSSRIPDRRIHVIMLVNWSTWIHKKPPIPKCPKCSMLEYWPTFQQNHPVIQ